MIRIKRLLGSAPSTAAPLLPLALTPPRAAFGQSFTITSGPPVTQGGNSDGASWGDYDNAGDLDLLMIDHLEEAGYSAKIYQNNAGDLRVTGS